MTKLSNDSSLILTDAMPQAPSPNPATSKPSEESLLDAMSKWMAVISKGTKRMTEDEAYRKEIAKNLS